MTSDLLLVEDDEDLGSALKRALEFHRFRVIWHRTGNSAIAHAASSRIAACVLDLGLPDLDGAAIIEDLRAHSPAVPVLVLTARDSVREKVRVLNLGADDYIVKPVDLDELVARINAVMRRAKEPEPEIVEINGLLLNPAARSVQLHGEPILLTAREFDVLFLIAKAYGKVISRDVIRAALEKWGDERDSNLIEVHIHNIRKKIGAELIYTVRGVGYMMRK